MASRVPHLPEIPQSHKRRSEASQSQSTQPTTRPSPREGGSTFSTGSARISPRNTTPRTLASLGLSGTGTGTIYSSASKTKYVLTTPTTLPGSPSHSIDTTNEGALVVAGEANNGQLVITSATAISPRADHRNTLVATSMLTNTDLRGIGNLVTFNSKLRHGQRNLNAAAAIPSLAFAARYKGVCDSDTGLQVASIDPQESALDVVLRLTSPEELRVPVLSDPKSNLPLATTLVGLLKGATSVPVHWAGEKEGLERDHSHVQALRDAKMRIEAAKRQENAYAEAKGRCCLAALHYNARNMEGVIKSLAPTVALFEECTHVAGLAFVHCTLGVAYYHNGEFKMSLVHFRKLEALCGSYGKAVARINMGVCYVALEEPQFAEQAFSDALASAQDAKESVLETIATGNRGLAYMRLGQMKSAQNELESCLELCSVAGDHVGTVVVLLLLGQNSAACKDYTQGLFYFEYALRVAEQVNCTPLASIAKVSVGVCRGQEESKGQLLSKLGTMGKPLSVGDVVKTMSIE